MYDGQLAQFGQDTSVVSYDRRGYGQTTAANEPFSHIDDLDAVVEDLGAKVMLVGCSQGGRISVDYTIQHPQKVKALVLVCATYSGASEGKLDEAEKRLIDQLEKADEANDIDTLNRLEAHLWLDGPRCNEIASVAP